MLPAVLASHVSRCFNLHLVHRRIKRCNAEHHPLCWLQYPSSSSRVKSSPTSLCSMSSLQSSELAQTCPSAFFSIHPSCAGRTSSRESNADGSMLHTASTRQASSLPTQRTMTGSQLPSKTQTSSLSLLASRERCALSMQTRSSWAM